MRFFRIARYAIPLAALLGTSSAHASVMLTPANPSVFAVYPAPLLTSDIKPTPNTGFIILEFADSNFGADDQLEVWGFNTLDGSGSPYLDASVNGPEAIYFSPVMSVTALAAFGSR